jgi:ribosome biogenesis GTPase / thiamine phosphate phosphatase
MERGLVLIVSRRQAQLGRAAGARRAIAAGAAEAAGRRGIVVSHLGIAVDVELEDGTPLRLRVERRSGIVVGDDIEVVGERAVQCDRRTALQRRSPGGGVHVVAANLDVLGIVAAVDPPARAGLVDRAAVAARAAGIEPFLIVNKVDLQGADEILAAARARVAGELTCFAVSAHDGRGVDEVAAFLAGRRGALVGPSGVGKSSILNRLVPGLDLKVRTLSEANGVGRHTTTVSTLHRLPGGGELVDTPGVREFGLVDVARQDLARFFPGFSNVEEPCRFRDCLHAEEPDCAIQQAVDDGRVDPARYVAYRTLLDELS